MVRFVSSVGNRRIGTSTAEAVCFFDMRRSRTFSPDLFTVEIKNSQGSSIAVSAKAMRLGHRIRRRAVLPLC